MAALEKLLSKYIQNTEQVFAEIKLTRDVVYIDREKMSSIIDMAKCYLEDAKYYRNRKQFETGLISISYGEGLLDALRLLDIVEFQWPRK